MLSKMHWCSNQCSIKTNQAEVLVYFTWVMPLGELSVFMKISCNCSYNLFSSMFVGPVGDGDTGGGGSCLWPGLKWEMTLIHWIWVHCYLSALGGTNKGNGGSTGKKRVKGEVTGLGEYSIRNRNGSWNGYIVMRVVFVLRIWSDSLMKQKRVKRFISEGL